MDADAQGQDDDGDSDDGAHMGGPAAQHAMPPPQPPVQQQWAPPAGYFDPYFASMQQSMSSQIAGLASQMQSQMTHGFQNMQQQMFQPMMAQMQGVQESLHSDIAALDSRFEDMPLLLCSLSSLSRGSSSLSRDLTHSAQFSLGFLITSTRCSRLQFRLWSSTRISRSTHHHHLHHRWIDLLGN